MGRMPHNHSTEINDEGRKAFGEQSEGTTSKAFCLSKIRPSHVEWALTRIVHPQTMTHFSDVFRRSFFYSTAHKPGNSVRYLMTIDFQSGQSEFVPVISRSRNASLVSDESVCSHRESKKEHRNQAKSHLYWFGMESNRLLWSSA
jgi:hypothetical protein